MALIVLNGIQGTSMPTPSDITPLSNLDSLQDVTITGPADGQVLTYSGAEWINSTIDITTELITDTSPQLGGNLDTNGKNITGLGGLSLLSGGSHGLQRSSGADGSAVLTLAKNTSTISGNSLNLKTLINFRAINNVADYAIGSIYAERNDPLSDISRELALCLNADSGARTDLFKVSRDSVGVDTVNVLTTMNTLGINTTGDIGVTGNVTLTGDLTTNSVVSSTDLDLTVTDNINITAFKMFTNAPMDMTIDNLTTTIPNAVLMNTLLPTAKDISNFMTAYMDYGSDSLPTQTQATFTFGVKQSAYPNGKITGRLVSTYNPGDPGDPDDDITNMQLRAYDVNSNTHYDLAVNKNYAYSTVPFKFPAIDLPSYTGVANAGMVLFDTDDSKLKCFDGTTWQALF